MSALVAVDWGTSSLRAALLTADGAVKEERGNGRGILTVEAGGFSAVLRELCGDWLAQAPLALVSGMAGSRQGWREAPYCACPAGRDDLAGQLAWIEPGRSAIVPGLSCEQDGVPDVMRGEEVQVFGTLDLLGIADALLVLPGTHSKWVEVRGGRIAAFRTFMTGEVYGLLRRHSILARTLPPHDPALDQPAFLQGVAHAARSGSLLHAAFSTRTLALFGRMSEATLASYLSGLVIGEELRVQALPRAGLPLAVVAAPELARRYELALESLGVGCRVLGSQATWRGLWAIARSLESRDDN